MWVYAGIASKCPIPWTSYSRNVNIAVENNQNELLCLILILVLLLNSKFNPTKFLSVFGYVALILSFLALPFQFEKTTYLLAKYCNFHLPARWISGIVINKSMNAILNASLLYFIYSPVTVVITVIVVMFSKSSCAYLALIGSMMYNHFGLNWMRRGRLLSWGWVVFPLIFGLYLVDKDIFWAGQRWEGYRFFFSDFTLKDWLIGKGPATFWAISTYRQAHESFQLDNGYYFFMHSDILQYLFEYGIFGFIFLIAAVPFKKLNKPTPSNSSFVALFLGGVFYYPFHFSVHLLVLFMVVSILYKHD